MSFWDSITSTAGDLYSSAKDTVGNVAGAVYDKAADIASSATKSVSNGINSTVSGLEKLTDGASVPWDTHTGASGTPVEKTGPTPAKTSPALLIGVAAAVGIALVYLTRKKG